MEQNNTETFVSEENIPSVPTCSAPQSECPQAEIQQSVPQQPAEPQPVYQQPVYPQPVPQQPVHPQIAAIQAQVAACANTAFSKALAAVIMAEFPIASIIAIFFARTGLQHAKAANDLAARYGLRSHGKSVAAKIMGIIGLVTGIVMTVFWAIYLLIAIIWGVAFFAILTQAPQYF